MGNKHIRAIWLWMRLVWREVEPKSCGIPDPYRIHGRISSKIAWETARRIWLED